MKRKKALIDTNPYLKDPLKRKKLIERSVITSCGVEGIKIDLKKKQSLNKSRNKKAQ